MVLIMDYNDKDKDKVGLIWWGFLDNIEIEIATWWYFPHYALLVRKLSIVYVGEGVGHCYASKNDNEEVEFDDEAIES